MKTLVIVQFRALSLEHIAAEDCPIDICVIPRRMDPHLPDQCTMQYALYRFAWRGWICLCVTLDSKERRPEELMCVRKSLLSLSGLTRKYEYFSGRPVWVDTRGRQYPNHPNGCHRDLVYEHRPRHNGTQEVMAFWV